MSARRSVLTVFRYSVLTLLLLLLLALGVSAVVGWKLVASLPREDGRSELPGLQSQAEVSSDHLGIPTVHAADRSDAFRVMGFLHARDRLFQMDLARRKSGGRLAELFGERALALDLPQRSYQAEQAAGAILRALPHDQRMVLEAYAEGVNAYMNSLREWPFEVIVLGYRPEPWRPEDSLLVAFGMFQVLTSQERDERMLTVMNRVLPPAVTAFLTPDTDSYSRTLLGGADSRRPSQPTPTAAIAGLLQENRDQQANARIDPDVGSLGSNQWAVSAKKSADGRAMVANDMHLNLSVPNIWYRAEIRYERAQLSGVMLPGLPLMVAGSNGRVAWGFTNVDSDVADLVRLELNPANPEQYRTPEGWREFTTSVETIRVRDREPVTIRVQLTVWGPVLREPLLGEPVAIRWTVLDPEALNLKLLDMDHAADLEQAISVMNRSGVPPQNVVLADQQGRIAWTLAGIFPKRRGFDGAVSVSWADGEHGWEGFLSAEEMPRLIDPAAGFVATANNRTLGVGYPHVIGHNYAHSYRAYRISQRLSKMEAIREEDLLHLQLDTESEFFEFYRQLVLQLTAHAASGAPDHENRLRPARFPSPRPSPAGGRGSNTVPLRGAFTVTEDPHLGSDSELAEARAAAEAWNGRLDADSQGIVLLVEYRKALMREIFGAMLRRCQRAEAQFSYGWREAETPLRALLSERSATTLPDPSFASWDAFLRDVLKSTVRRLKEEQHVERLDALNWGRVNRVSVRHPFGKMAAWLSPVLDMPELASPGCAGYCVRVLSGEQGASERFVVSPGRHGDGILHMPGGQSGHPLSTHYRDQQQAWAEGRRLPFSAGPGVHRLVFQPRRLTD